MKSLIQTITLFSLILTLFAYPAVTEANNQPRLWLQLAQEELLTGQTVQIDILVEDAPLVYGIEAHLKFDPTELEVVALEHGDFFTTDPDRETFALQNQFNNQAGSIDYAVVLLNPAPPVQGKGRLLSITAQVKGGNPTIRLDEALFGTQTGQEISPVVPDPEMNIDIHLNETEELSSTVSQVSSIDDEIPGPTQSTINHLAQESLSPSLEVEKDQHKLVSLPILIGVTVIIGVAVLAGLALLIGGWLWWIYHRRFQSQA